MPDEPWVRTETDEDGTSVIIVSDEHLANFPKLMRSIINHEIGLDRGYFKIRLDSSVSKSQDIAAMLDFISAYFTRKQPGTKNIPKPDFQSFYSGSEHEDFYGFRINVSISREKYRQKSVANFVDAVSNANTYVNQSNCCLTALNIGVTELVEHYWSCVRERSIKSPHSFPCLNPKKSDPVCSSKEALLQGSNHIPKSPILYGSSIPLKNVSFPITRKFNMSQLRTILDLNSQNLPGISFPYLYAGTLHASFPYHIEDCALFSINYVHFGAPCVWFIVAPEHYKKFVDFAHHFRLDLGQVSCNNVLGHKYIMASEEFLRGLGIIVNTVVQQANEFLVTYPFAAHSGFKCGFNIQQAANFGDEWWVEPAILAPTCTCFIYQVKFDLSGIIASVKPHLLQFYVSNDVTKLLNELSKNDFIKKIGVLPLKPPEKVPSPSSHSSEDKCNMTLRTEKSPKSSTKLGARCTLECPDTHCSETWSGGRSRLKRVVAHIEKFHQNSSILLNKLNKMYPPIETKKTVQCPLCKSWIGGNNFHLKRHMRLKHS